MSLKHIVIQSIFSVVCACAALTAFAASSSQVNIPLHRSEIVSISKPVAKFSVANDSVADVSRQGNKRLIIEGRSVGTTSVKALDAKGDVIQIISVTIVPDLPSVRQSLKTLLPHENVGVEMIGNNIALTGVVSDAEAATRAVTIASEYVKGQGYGKDVVNLMQVASGQQVMLRVRVGEIQRTALKRIGASLQGLRTAGGYKIPFATGSEIGTSTSTIGVGADSFLNGGVIYNSPKLDLSASLDLLERDGVFKILAEPNLVAVSGKQADFLAGGEFPVPVAQGDERMSVDYKKFGVSVSFTPQVLSQNRIRLKVEPEVSELSDEGAVTTEQFSIPSVTTRRASTTVELAPGESFMVAGLIKDQWKSVLDQTPGLSHIPVLGAALRHSDTQRNETELVIAVTPYLVNPMTNSDVRLPTDYFRPATVLETLFFGALGSKVSSPNPSTTSLEGPVGFMMD